MYFYYKIYFDYKKVVGFCAKIAGDDFKGLARNNLKIGQN